jgi:hypothetical protein
VLVGRPELKDFLRYIEAKSLANCQITRQDAINAHAILGHDLGAIKGKTTRRKLKGILWSNRQQHSKVHPDTVLRHHIVH